MSQKPTGKGSTSAYSQANTSPLSAGSVQLLKNKRHCPDRQKVQEEKTEDKEMKESPSPMLESGCKHTEPREDKVEERVFSSIEALPIQLKVGQAYMTVTCLDPILVHSASSNVPRTPTRKECECFIRYLWGMNHIQMQELKRLKTFLGDVAYNNKWTSETHLLAKTLLQSPTRDQEVVELPKVSEKNTLKKWIQAPICERVILPALKQTLGSNFAERQKRTQAKQRSRARRTVL
ncbi:uncharacterized protein LOC115100948 isoform X2 [Rhinatrema bivittatum]|nr:uncharacterized protein LOC115100948 isoform X2 [Rhinatrema bivittatum]XP_029475925.1 uncharacterized protein LOC115100948 isoform X2 [Rhinatrema bivittatum]XP_029475926.1 uncharacterized protein LOC115100948 isoform X2 [Rhinatrema bivittatum]XP_029475927.1 uncharacterized protein LOC115100948 isoform X2 [Rhinatrema bivittatum]